MNPALLDPFPTGRNDDDLPARTAFGFEPRRQSFLAGRTNFGKMIYDPVRVGDAQPGDAQVPGLADGKMT